MKTLLIYLFCLYLFNTNLYSQTLTLDEFTNSCKQDYKFHLDPNLGLLKIKEPKNLALSCAEKIKMLSLSTPLRILWDRDYLTITAPVFRSPTEPKRFEAIIIAKQNDALDKKLDNTGKWFLRNRVYRQQKGKFIEIQLSCKKEFFLNQFYSDFQEFSHWLFPNEIPLEFVTKEKDWLNFQRDLLFENFTGHQPGYQKRENLNGFQRHRRRGVLSDVP